MKVSGDQTLVPQAEEQITQVKWLGVGDLEKIIGNTFPSIIDVLHAAGVFNPTV